MTLSRKILKVLGEKSLTVDEIHNELKDDHEKYEINSRMAVLVKQGKARKDYTAPNPKPFYTAIK
tara:strand:- start:1573 stop:1767 length:195 start_codon:yes stop_codon:yes gene_type:complete